MPPLEARDPARIRKHEGELIQRKRVMENELRKRAVAACVEHDPENRHRSATATYRTRTQGPNEKTAAWILKRHRPSAPLSQYEVEFRVCTATIAEDGTETVVPRSNRSLFTLSPEFGLIARSGHDLSTEEKIALLQDGLDTMSLIEAVHAEQKAQAGQ